MADFTKAFDERKDSYLAHYGTPGMRWGVRNEYQPVGQQGSYSEEETQSMKQTADKVKQASPEDVKEKRKRIVKNIVKGVAVTALVTGIVAGGIKGYAKKQTGKKQDLATSIGIVGQRLSKTPGNIKSKVEKGFNMNIGATLGANKAARTRKRNENIAKAKENITKTKDAMRNLWFDFKSNPRRYMV